MGDIKVYLRKIDFPDVVPEALKHMQKLWLPDCTSQQITLMREMSQEFVFFEVDQWGHVREQKLNPIKELQVLDKLCSYFKDSGPEQKLATFIFLFPFGSNILEKRLSILCKLTSLSMGIGNNQTLDYIGAWMQIAGCASRYSVSIARSIVQEHLRINCYKNKIIHFLPRSSQLFCASLATSLATMYVLTAPPNHIVEVVLNWLKMKPSFCFEALNLNIPKTFNFNGPQTPLPEIIHWTILSPLMMKRDETDALFSSLHRAIIECMLCAPKVKMISKYECIPTERIVLIVDALKGTEAYAPENMAVCLERLAHCIETGLSNNCIHHKPNSLRELFTSCIKLPYHQLLKIVLQKWSNELETEMNLFPPDVKMSGTKS